MKFKDYMIEEGEMFDAVKHGMSSGFKAFREKRVEQKNKSDNDALTAKIVTAEGDELKQIIKQIVSKGLTVKDGKVQEPCRIKHVNKGVLECTRTKMA